MLSRAIVKKYNIEPYNVVGHSDITTFKGPNEIKFDPGILFPWGGIE